MANCGNIKSNDFKTKTASIFEYFTQQKETADIYES